MKKRIWYPTVNDVINYNKLVINNFRATKGESFKILNRRQIENSLSEAREFPGDVTDKAAVLVRKLQYHPFASANRRTAYLAMNNFLWKNSKYAILKKKKSGKDFMRKIRRGELTHQQIKEMIS